MTESLIGFAVLLLLIFLRMPIAFAMGVVGFGAFAIIEDMPRAMSMMVLRFEEVTQNYELAVVPLFILMGNLVAKAGLSNELYRAAYAFLAHRRGGLAMATIVACGGFSAICGSSLATAATMSKVAMPSMRKYGYSDELATASIASGGTLGILIPPSVILVIYGIMTRTSIGELFAAGFLPGFLGILLYLCAVQYVVIRKPASGPRGEKVAWRERFIALSEVGWTVALFALVIGGIYTGAFTPNEASGVGAAGALLIALIRRRLSWEDLKEVVLDTTRTTATLFLVLIGALIFSNFINRAALPTELVTMINGMELSPYLVILVILIIYIILGCVFESLSMLLLTIPVFVPLVQTLDLGIDPRFVTVWFGIVAVVVTEISLITPPVGLNVFVLSGVLRDVKTTTIFKGVTPFWCADLVRLAIIVLIPWVSLTLARAVAQ